MADKKFPLEEVSIEQLFNGGSDIVTYEIPIYQRNYTWGKDEISALVHDVYDAFVKSSSKKYYIGTLVTYSKGDRMYEVIDGQQRLTTIKLILDALEITHKYKLTYKVRKKSDETLKYIRDLEKVDKKDIGIERGFKFVIRAIDELGLGENKAGFIKYFLESVHIIHYQVPKDIDLNHYFEIMNSRGEQLEKHEIVKAELMAKLTSEDHKVFNSIWESCSEMSTYIQQNLNGFKAEDVFGATLDKFEISCFADLRAKFKQDKKDEGEDVSLKEYSIEDLLKKESPRDWHQKDNGPDRKDPFQPIIDFSNFLLIVLKISRMKEIGFCPSEFNLDDKELLIEFREAKMDDNRVKDFAFDLLKARFLLDNYIVHHSNEDDSVDNNPWKLQVWHKEPGTKSSYAKNLTEDVLESKLAHLLSMFEVAFSAKQRKNYLFYCLYYLMNADSWDVNKYAEFVEQLADRFFYEIYLDKDKLNDRNTPLPGKFDETLLGALLDTDYFNVAGEPINVHSRFVDIYGDGTDMSKGIPLFIFNYLDYRLWKLYDSELRGNDYNDNSPERKQFFNEELGCSDFGLKVFDKFYFSRTRTSLEHFFPRANVGKVSGDPDENKINCFGNFAMIGSEANSAGSNWDPPTKLTHYIDDHSGKIKLISVSSLKFMVMMQLCKDKSKWGSDEIDYHQEKMLKIVEKRD